MALIVIFLARPFALSKAFPRGSYESDESSKDAAVGRARKLGCDEDETTAILNEAEKLAAKYCERYWGEIKAVAHALYEENTMTGSELKEIYDSVKVRHSLRSLNLKRTAARV